MKLKILRVHGKRVKQVQVRLRKLDLPQAVEEEILSGDLLEAEEIRDLRDLREIREIQAIGDLLDLREIKETQEMWDLRDLLV
jgi:hypothetical protein